MSNSVLNQLMLPLWPDVFFHMVFLMDSFYLTVKLFYRREVRQHVHDSRKRKTPSLKTEHTSNKWPFKSNRPQQFSV